MKKPFLFLFVGLISGVAVAQKNDEAMVKSIFDTSLKNGESYEMLEHLTMRIGSRLSGSPGAAAAVEWSRQVMTAYGFDSVWLQPVMVPHWVRGKKEIGRIVNSKKLGTMDVNICALGGSIGTGAAGVSGQVIEVKDFEELKQLGTKNVQGRIVYFSRPMDPTLINTFAAYGGAVNQRGGGASEAAKYGAVAAIVRSMGSNIEEYPHTGGMSYADGVPKIPSVAISTAHGDMLSRLLQDDKEFAFLYGNLQRDIGGRAVIQCDR